MPFEAEENSEHNLQELRRLCTLRVSNLRVEEIKELFGFKPDEILTKEEIKKAYNQLLHTIVFPATEILAQEKERLDLILFPHLLNMCDKLIASVRKPFPLAGKLSLAEIKEICALNPAELSVAQAKRIFGFGPEDPINVETLDAAHSGFIHELISPVMGNLTGGELSNVLNLAAVAQNQLYEFRYNPQKEAQAAQQKGKIFPEEEKQENSPDKIILYKTHGGRAGAAKQGFNSGFVAIVFPTSELRDKFTQTTRIGSSHPGEVAVKFKDEDKRAIFLPYSNEDGKDVISFDTEQQAQLVYKLLFGNSPLYQCEANTISFDMGLHNIHLCGTRSATVLEEALDQKKDADFQPWTTAFLLDFSDNKPPDEKLPDENAILYEKIDAIGMEARYHIFRLIEEAEKTAIKDKVGGMTESEIKKKFEECKNNLLSKATINFNSIEKALNIFTDKKASGDILESIKVYYEIIKIIPDIQDRKGSEKRGGRNAQPKEIEAKNVFSQMDELMAEKKTKMGMRSMRKYAEQWNKFEKVYCLASNKQQVEIDPELQKNCIQNELHLLQGKFDLTANKPKPRFLGERYTKAEKEDLKHIKENFLDTLKALVKLHSDPIDRILIYQQYRASSVVKTHRESGFFRSLGRTATAIVIDNEIKALQKELKSKPAKATIPVPPISKPPYSQPRV